MKFIVKILFACIISFASNCKLIAQWIDAFEIEGGCTIDLVQSLDNVNNFQSYMSLSKIEVTFDTEKAHFFKGGSLFVRGQNNYCSRPSSDIYSEHQVISNIEAENRSYFLEMFYQQQWKKFNIKLGLLDLNSDFVVTQMADIFANSSFGISPTYSNNMPVSIFPSTTFGAALIYNPVDLLTIRYGLFDGYHGDAITNKGNMDWQWSKNDGLLHCAEISYYVKKDNVDNTSITLGFCHHSGVPYYFISDSSKTISGNYGIHLLAEQFVYQNINNLPKKLGLFTQLSYCPHDRNFVESYIGGGICFTGLNKKTLTDKFAIGINYAGLNKVLVNNKVIEKHETIFSLAYQAELTNNIAVQPDIQYILNSKGTTEKNFVGIMRFIISF